MGAEEKVSGGAFQGVAGVDAIRSRRLPRPRTEGGGSGPHEPQPPVSHGSRWHTGAGRGRALGWSYAHPGQSRHLRADHGDLGRHRAAIARSPDACGRLRQLLRGWLRLCSDLRGLPADNAGTDRGRLCDLVRATPPWVTRAAATSCLPWLTLGQGGALLGAFLPSRHRPPAP